ncbi:hypothetical protein BT63DRAFT_389247, partial [Microthyrium microscopicum]
MFTYLMLSIVSLTTAIDVTCPIFSDGRISPKVTPAQFDETTSPFSSSNVKGDGLKFSQILTFPDIPASRFDIPSGKPVQININDKSIFKPGGGTPQTGFRRAGLLLANNDGKDASNTGVKTFHWSVRTVASKPLNYSHEYINVWHETDDYSASQWNFQTGDKIGKPATGSKDWWIVNRRNERIFTAPASSAEWQNFAITTDFVKNTIQVFSSIGNEPLVNKTGALPNDNSGAGQFQIGILKKGKGGGGPNQGTQPSNINEGLIYGGIFIEDSAQGCIS